MSAQLFNARFRAKEDSMSSEMGLLETTQQQERYRRRYETLKGIFERRLSSLTNTLAQLSVRLTDDKILRELRENPTSAAFATAYADEVVQLEVRHEREAFIESLAVAIAEAEDQVQYYRETLQKQQVESATLKEKLHLAVQEAFAMRAKAEEVSDLQSRRRAEAHEMATLGRQLLEERRMRSELEDRLKHSGAASEERIQGSAAETTRLSERISRLEEKVLEKERENTALREELRTDGRRHEEAEKNSRHAEHELRGALEEAQTALTTFEVVVLEDEETSSRTPLPSIRDRLKVCKKRTHEKLASCSERARKAEAAAEDGETRLRLVSQRLEESEQRSRNLERQVTNVEATLVQKSEQLLSLQQSASASHELVEKLRETIATKEKQMQDREAHWERHIEDVRRIASAEEQLKAEKDLTKTRAEDASMYNSLAKQFEIERGHAAVRIAELESELEAIYTANPPLRAAKNGEVVQSLLTKAEATVQANDAVQAAIERLSSKHELEKQKLRSDLEASYQRDMFSRLQEDNSHVLDVREQLKSYVAKYNKAEEDVTRETSRANLFEEKYHHVTGRITALNDHLEEANANITRLGSLVEDTEGNRKELERLLELEKASKEEVASGLREQLSEAQKELVDVRDRLNEALKNDVPLEHSGQSLEVEVELPPSLSHLRNTLRSVVKCARTEIMSNLETMKRDVEAVALTHMGNLHPSGVQLPLAQQASKTINSRSPLEHHERVVQMLMKIFTSHHENARNACNRTGWSTSELCEELRNIHQEAADFAACLARTQQKHDDFEQLNQQLIDCVQTALRTFGGDDDDDNVGTDTPSGSSQVYRKLLGHITSSLTSVLRLESTEADELRSLAEWTDEESDLSGGVYPDTPSRDSLRRVVGLNGSSVSGATTAGSPQHFGSNPSEIVISIISRAVARLKSEAIDAVVLPLNESLRKLEKDLRREQELVEVRTQQVATLKEELDMLRGKGCEAERTSEAESGVTQEVERRQPLDGYDPQRSSTPPERSPRDTDALVDLKQAGVENEIDFLRSQLQEKERHLLTAVEDERQAVEQEYSIQLEQARQEIEHLRHRVVRIEEIGDNSLKIEREAKRAELDFAEKKCEELHAEHKLLQEKYEHMQTELERVRRSHYLQAVAKSFPSGDATEYSRMDSSFGEAVPVTSLVRRSDETRVQKLLKSIDDSFASS